MTSLCQRKYDALFDHLDNNDDGVIDMADWNRYAQVMRKELGWAEDEPRLAGLVQATNAWWSDMQQAMGLTGDQGISRPQFSRFLGALAQQLRAGGQPPPWAVQMCLQIHQMLDMSGTGSVDANEYSLWLRAIGSKADPAVVFTKLDLNGDGVVSRDEMIQLFAQFMTSEDLNDPGNYLMTGEF